MEDDVEIDFKVVANGIILEYGDNVVGFPQTKGVDHDVTLGSRFYQDEGFDLVQVVLAVK